MYEICRLLAPKKSPKPRAPRKAAIRVGAFATLTINGERVKIVAKQDGAAAYYVENMSGVRLRYSFARNVLKVEE